jgi:hypothetical protein
MTCPICKHHRHARTGERTVKLQSTLAALGIDGESAHATCVVEARRKAEAKALRTARPLSDPLRRSTARARYLFALAAGLLLLQASGARAAEIVCEGTAVSMLSVTLVVDALGGRACSLPRTPICPDGDECLVRGEPVGALWKIGTLTVYTFETVNATHVKTK